MIDEDDLPEGWAIAKLGDVVTCSTEKVEPGEQDGAPYLSLEHIESHTSRITGQGVGSDVRSVKSAFRAGEVLYGKLRPYLNKVCRPDFNGICSTDILVLRPTEAIDAGFLHRLLTTPQVVQYAVNNSSGINLPRTSFQALSELDIGLPPFAEQCRIVARIEALQARSRKARETLEAIPTLLEQYRQSVLASAFRGDLTADWREHHPDVEPASALLDRIRQERRRQWEAKNPRKKYVEPEPVDDSDLPELPEGWCWTAVGELCSLITSGSRGWAEFYSDTGAMFIRSQDINTDKLDLRDVARVNVPDSTEGQRTRVSQGDVLITITGANVGRCAPVTTQLDEAYISQHVALLRLVDAQLAGWLHLWTIAAGGGRGMLLADVYGNGKPGLNLDNIRNLPVPLAPPAEQITLRKAVDLAESRVQLVREQVRNSTAELALFDQSILAKVFRGEMVEQDPSDEPASVLLERIRAEREQSNGSTRKARRPRQ